MTWKHWGLLTIVLLGISLLGGCAGMPGMPGAGGQQQQGPPGLTPPPGLKSGGVRTLMGTVVTAPDNGTLSVHYTLATAKPAEVAASKDTWRHCRRIVMAEGTVTIEGLDFDKSTAQKDVETSIAFPVNDLTELSWKYDTDKLPPPPAKAPDSAAKGK